MATEKLIAQLLEAPGPAAIDALRALLDDSTIDDDAPPKTVTEAAALTQLPAPTLRYYEDAGLVRPARNAAGRREYAASDLRRLIFIMRMRASGMTMRDLKRYIALVEQGPETEPERRAIMLEQRERIRRQLRELTLALDATEYKIRRYGGAPDG